MNTNKSSFTNYFVFCSYNLNSSHLRNIKCWTKVLPNSSNVLSIYNYFSSI
nr:MAG TPA: hypothetical protein [Bacteriophage sp.]